VATLEQIKRWWDEGLIPPNSPSWDDAGNNQAYQSGQVAFAFNPASIFAYLEENDPDLLADTTQAPDPGRVGRQLPGHQHLGLGPSSRAAPASTRPRL
jgi:multiple sugar transport system substrate-binding protein